MINYKVKYLSVACGLKILFFIFLYFILYYMWYIVYN
jgi:hypothetical protein